VVGYIIDEQLVGNTEVFDVLDTIAVVENVLVVESDESSVGRGRGCWLSVGRRGGSGMGRS